MKDDVVGGVADCCGVVMATIGLGMLIACANVANLLLVRAEVRQRELAVRAALGAARGRIVRSLLVESVLLGLIGGAVGTGLAYGGLRVLVALGPTNLPRLNEFSLDGRTFAFTVVLSVLSSVLFGLIPALKHTGPRFRRLGQPRPHGERQPRPAPRPQRPQSSCKWPSRWCSSSAPD